MEGGCVATAWVACMHVNSVNMYSVYLHVLIQDSVATVSPVLSCLLSATLHSLEDNLVARRRRFEARHGSVEHENERVREASRSVNKACAEARGRPERYRAPFFLGRCAVVRSEVHFDYAWERRRWSARARRAASVDQGVGGGGKPMAKTAWPPIHSLAVATAEIEGAGW